MTADTPLVRHTSSIALSRSAFLSNIAFVRSLLQPATRLSAVLKGNAYGHGLEQMAQLCLEADLTHISVFSAQEALRVWQKTEGAATILIMGLIENEDLAWAIGRDIEFFVFDLDRLQAAIAAARSVGKPARIHLEVETGMNRTGFDNEALPEVLALLRQHREELSLASLCTHFAGAEEMTNADRIGRQLEQYNAVWEQFCSAGLQPPMRHTACSAATLNYPETRMELVRIGIMLYGFWPNLETRSRFLNNQQPLDREPRRQEPLRQEPLRQDPLRQDPLRRLIRWHSKIMSVKVVRQGEYVGYGTAFQAKGDMRIASVPVGYAYGFARSLSNVGRVLVQGQAVAVVGVVNMNLMMIDITELPAVQKGDEVVLIGRQGEQEISVASFSEMSHQLNYEMLTRLPTDIPRIIVD